MRLPRGRERRRVSLVCLGTFLFILYVVFQRKLFPEFVAKKESLTKVRVSSRDTRISRSFSIDFAADSFLMDGQPFRFVSGSFHYFRAPPSKWRTIMRSMRAVGLNALSTYVEWSSHEVSPGKYSYEGFRDVEHFLRLADEEGLYVLLRPGPFISAERDFGGFPPWLLAMEPDIKLRRNNEAYQRHVMRWFGELFRTVEKHLYGKTKFLVPEKYYSITNNFIQGVKFNFQDITYLPS